MTNDFCPVIVQIQPHCSAGGLDDDDASQFAPMWGKLRQYLLQIVWTALADQNLVGFIGHHPNAIVRMQVYATKSHLGLARFMFHQEIASLRCVVRTLGRVPEWPSLAC